MSFFSCQLIFLYFSGVTVQILQVFYFLVRVYFRLFLSYLYILFVFSLFRSLEFVFSNSVFILNICSSESFLNKVRIDKCTWSVIYKHSKIWWMLCRPDLEVKEDAEFTQKRSSTAYDWWILELNICLEWHRCIEPLAPLQL